MNTNQSNDSFQSARVFCSKAKTRLFLLASLPCLIGSVWAGSLSVDLTLSDALMKIVPGSLVPTTTPRVDPVIDPVIVPVIPIGKKDATPLGPPITPRAHKSK